MNPEDVPRSVVAAYGLTMVGSVASVAASIPALLFLNNTAACWCLLAGVALFVLWCALDEVVRRLLKP